MSDERAYLEEQRDLWKQRYDDALAEFARQEEARHRVDDELAVQARIEEERLKFLGEER